MREDCSGCRQDLDCQDYCIKICRVNRQHHCEAMAWDEAMEIAAQHRPYSPHGDWDFGYKEAAVEIMASIKRAASGRRP